MIEKVEKICEGWYLRGEEYCNILEEIEANKGFRDIMSQQLKDTIWELYNYVSDDVKNDSYGAISNITAFLNFKCGEKVFARIYELRYAYILRVNGLLMKIVILNEDVEGGYEENSFRIADLDKNGDDDFWISIVNELFAAAKGELDSKDGFKYKDWYYIQDKNERK